MIRILSGDCRAVLAELPDQSVHCCVTSPPYFGLRDYGVGGQIGLEPTPDAYVAELVAVFREVRRVLRDDGTVWLNLGDSYASGGTGGASDKSRLNGGRGVGLNEKIKQGPILTRSVPPGLKPKDLIGIPWLVAFALRADGWYLRSDIIWHKPNPMPESVTDRPTSAHEHVFLFAKNARYWYDADAVKEEALNEGRIVSYNGTQKNTGHQNRTYPGAKPRDILVAGRNLRNVWTVATQPYAEAHFATFPPKLIEPCIKAGCPKGGTVLDPFGGAGTTGLVADRMGRDAILIELNPEYAEMARRRVKGDSPLFSEVETQPAAHLAP